jgi:hypothetical protein
MVAGNCPCGGQRCPGAMCRGYTVTFCCTLVSPLRSCSVPSRSAIFLGRRRTPSTLECSAISSGLSSPRRLSRLSATMTDRQGRHPQGGRRVEALGVMESSLVPSRRRLRVPVLGRAPHGPTAGPCPTDARYQSSRAPQRWPGGWRDPGCLAPRAPLAPLGGGGRTAEAWWHPTRARL